MGVIVVVAYTIAIWLVLAVLVIAVLNLAKWRVRAGARTRATPPAEPAPAGSLPPPIPDRPGRERLRPEMAAHASSTLSRPSR